MIFDLHKNHIDLYKFRLEAIKECNGKEELINFKGSYQNFIKLTTDNKRREDIYRFTDEKWSRTEFTFVQCHYVDVGIISNISGVKVYNNWIKGAMYHFALQKYSKEYPSVFFSKFGHLSRLIQLAKNKNLYGVFISILPHNKKLSLLCKALKKGTGIPTKGDISLIRQFKFAGSFQYNNVLQDFFVLSLNGENFDIASLSN